MCELHQRVVVLSATVLFLRWTFISSLDFGLRSSKVLSRPCTNSTSLVFYYMCLISIGETPYINAAPFNNMLKKDWLPDCWYIYDDINMADVNGKEDPTLCPIGFKPAHIKGLAMCYKLKDRENFKDFYNECAKNIFSLELYNQLDIDKSNVVWSEYKAVYPGGPFHKIQFTDHQYHELDSKYKVTYQKPNLEIGDDLCIVIDPVNNYVAVRCAEKHYRYCFVEPMAVNNDDVLKDRCKDLKDSLRFSSPVPTCLTVVNLGKKGFVMYETKKPQEICKEKKSSLLNRGWIYVNHQRFERANYLINVTQSQGFEVSAKGMQSKYTYLIYNETSLVQSDHIFSNLICERIIRPVHVPRPALERDPVKYVSTESEKLLYLRDKQTLQKVYAVKCRTNIGTIIDDPESMAINVLKIYSEEKNVFTNIDKICKHYIKTHFNETCKHPEIFKGLEHIKLMRKYLDGKTALYHIKLNSHLKAEPLRSWNNGTMLSIRPVYYCDELTTDYGEKVSRIPMGKFITFGCETYSCVGNLIEGVTWNKSLKVDCKERKLDRVIADLQRIVNESVPVDNITTVFREVNIILQEKKKFKNRGRLLPLLEQLGATVKLNELQTAMKTVETNMALLVTDNNPDRQIWGFQIRKNTQNNSQFTNDSFEFMTNLPDASIFNSSISDVVVVLPAFLARSTVRVSFMAFRNEDFSGSLFGDPHFGIANSLIISVIVHNLTQFEPGEVLDIHFSPIRTNILRNESQGCAYWRFTGDIDDTGYWSQDGCIFIRATRPGMLNICRCDQLRHFAQVLVPRIVFSEKNKLTLEIMSIVGCVLSILGLIMIVVTAATFRIWRQEFSNKIWLQLCMSILFRSICFLTIALAKFDHYNSTCMIFGIALHYSVLCSFCWMLVAAMLSYRKLVLVFTKDPTRKLLRACTFSYGTPCVVIGVLLSISSDSYAERYEKMTPPGSFCYPSGLSLWISVYAPLASILLANLMFFACIVYSIFVSQRLPRCSNSKEALRCVSVSCLLVFLFGLPWISGLFTSNLVAAYIFTITSTFQGFILFIYLGLGNAVTRNMWLKWIKTSC